MRTSRFTRAIALSVLTALAGTALAQPATTAFTYQGRLTAGGLNQTGNYDFQFKLFDAGAGGSQLGATLTFNTVAVSGGLFTSVLDFGQQFNSTRRWLEIGVRTSGGGSFTILSPRQELTAAPHAEGLVLPISGSTAASNALSITSTGGNGILGLSTIGITAAGVVANSTANGGNGLIANANTGSNAFGAWVTAAQGYGVVSTGAVYGVDSTATDVGGIGVFGIHSASTGTAAGVEGDTSSTDGFTNAVYGHVTSASPGGNSTAVRGINEGTGGSGIGVWGSQAGTGWGVLGSVGGAGLGVFGSASGAGTGVLGFAGTGGTGVSGSADVGVRGSGGTATGYGVLGVGASANVGVRGEASAGGGSSFGGYFISTASIGNGLYGECSVGSAAYGVWGTSTTGDAGHFSGNVHVLGALSKTSGSFQIDHPLDPANKYLFHSFVESPDMMNIYNGNVQLDGTGSATITMPDWFEALNADFRYQLTAIGAPGPNLYVAQTMKNRQFVIAGGSPGGAVSWQVTGVRQDAWATQHRIQVEVMKSPEERGRYLHPELFGMPASASIDALKLRPGAIPPEQLPRSGNVTSGPSPAPAPVPNKEAR
jgi:hypothetical protein